MLDKWKEFFAFSRAERHGVLILLILIALLLTINLLLPFFVRHRSSDFSEFAKELALFEQQLIVDGEPNRSDQSYSHTGANRPKREEQLPPAAESGGRQNTGPRNDLYIQQQKATPIKVNLNIADTVQLMSLHGIGPVFAKRIVRYREKLGGYYATEQLLEVYGLDSAKYIMIKDKVYTTIDTNIRKINLNRASVKELAAHPYIDWKLANAIVRRRFAEPYERVDQLRELYLVNDSLFRKLVPYLTIE